MLEVTQCLRGRLGSDSGLLDSRARCLANKFPKIGDIRGEGQPGESQGLGLRRWVSWRGGKGSCNLHRTALMGAGPELGGRSCPTYLPLTPLSSLPTAHTRLLSVPFGDTAPPTHILMHPGFYRNQASDHTLNLPPQSGEVGARAGLLLGVRLLGLWRSAPVWPGPGGGVRRWGGGWGVIAWQVVRCTLTSPLLFLHHRQRWEARGPFCFGRA